MAVNKNFTVRNGLEVNTKLILADANTNKVGIGSTGPRFELDVAGGIGATDFYLSGVGTFANELNVGTDGSVLTVLGVGGSVGVGTALPAYLLDIRSATTTGTTALYVQGDVQITGDLSVDDITFDDASVNNLTVIEALNVTSPGISTFGGYVDINDNVDISGTLNVGGATTLGGYVDINSAADFSSTVNISGITTVGGYADFNSDVDISGTLNVTGITTLTDLNVTGIATIATVDINAGDIEVTNVDTANLNVTGIATIATISVVGAALSSLIVSGIGTIQTADINAGEIDVSRIETGDLSVTGISTLGTVEINAGIITATSGIVTYYGDGSKLTNILSGVGISSLGTLIGIGATILNFVGTALSTVTVSSGIATIKLDAGAGGGGGTPGGSDGQVQYNSAGAFAGSANFTFDGSNVNISGIVTAIDFNSTSDQNLKTNIKTVDHALDIVKSLRGVSFDWKETGKGSYGVIAQELEEILPELVTNTDPKTVNYNGIIGVLIEAVKDLSKQVEELRNSK